MSVRASLSGNSWAGVLIASITGAIVIGLSFWLYGDIIDTFPSHIHAWTQSDRLALAYGYLDNGLNFFLPCTYNVYTPEGITGVDFPIHEYLVAVIMKVTGVHEPVVFRLYTLIYSFIGYIFLYLLGLRATKSHFKASIGVLFAFTCPIITYYQAGFIPSATSLANCYIGFYYYLIYKRSDRLWHLIAGIGFLTLAAMPRLSVNVVLFAVLLTEVAEWYFSRQVDRRATIGFAVAYAMVGIGLAYKTWLNSAYGSRFLTKLLPADSGSDFISITSSVWERWSLQVMTPYHWAVMAVAVIALALAAFKGKVEEKDRPHIVLGLLLFAGTGAFYLALAKQFVDHEYYFMDSLYQGLILMLIIGLKFIPIDSYLARMIWPAFFVGSFIGMIVQSKAVQDVKYAYTDWDRGEVTRKNFTGSDVFLDSLGIGRDARILVYEAHSTNGPLLLMGRKGYTVLNSHEENIRRALDLDFDYIVIQDPYIASDVVANAAWITDCLERVAGNGKVTLFRQSDCERTGRGRTHISELLGLDSVTMVYTGSPGNFVDSLGLGALSNMEKRVTSEIEFGPTLALPIDSLRGASTLLIEINYELDGSIPLPLEYSIDLAATMTNDSVIFRSHPVKVRSHGSGVYYCTFDLEDLQDVRSLKTYVWNRYRADTGIDSVSFRLYD